MSFLTDSGFCNDRSGTSSAYGAYLRLYTNKTPTFSCPNIAGDLYTISSNSIGNKKLTYPIGLITADEIGYAGVLYGNATGTNLACYLEIGDNYWTMSPAKYSTEAFELSAGYGALFGIYQVGLYSFGYRPVINLKADVLVSSGTGTLVDPWIIAS